MERPLADPRDGGEDVDVLKFLPSAADHVVDDFNHPVRVAIVDPCIAVASHLVVQRCDRHRDGVCVHVPARHHMDQADEASVLQ